MSKRFEYVPFEGFKDNGFYMSPYEIVDLLNEQDECIRQLKSEKLKEML